MLVLTATFFCLWLLTATQDIAVDGWALTMLQRRNVGHAATCNSVGQATGAFIGFIVLLILESKDFANAYVFNEPQDVGLVKISSFLQFWGIVFLGTTILIAIFKKESSESDGELENHPEYGIKKAYPMLWKIVKLKPIMKFALAFLTVKISFVAVDGISIYKLMSFGLPANKIALLVIPLTPIQILLPFIMSRFTAGPHPMRFYMKAFPFRLAVSVVIGVFVFYSSKILGNDADIPISYYAAIVIIYSIYQIPLKAMLVGEFLNGCPTFSN
jgi:MFS transporter, PAT family, solute carrier family 33 (acetyl-CoA transportor), member 1